MAHASSKSPFSKSRWTLATLAGLGGAALLAGCGGGGSGDGGVAPPSGNQLVGAPPVIQKLETPLGLVGSRGAGSGVYVSFNIRDREYNPTNVQIEYGYDVNGNGEIEGSAGEPTTTDEYFTCTADVILSDPLVGLDSATGQGADHLFVWDTAIDLPGARFMSQDYLFNAQGRFVDDEGNLIPPGSEPVFRSYPALKMRARANDSTSNIEKRWSPWKVTVSFDLNNNRAPAATIDLTGLNGVTPNATGTAADENVVLSFKVIDQDSTLPTGTDFCAVNVDYAPVAPGANLGDPLVVAALNWQPASKAAGTSDVDFAATAAPGTPGTFTWDSVRDVGTVNGDYILRLTPFNSHLASGSSTLQTKNEPGTPVMMAGVFRLDNYTVFTNDARMGLTVDDTLSSGRVGHRATLLASGNVLVAGGRTSSGGASVATAERFLVGAGQTTTGVVVSTGGLNAARSYHSMTRLFDDRILVAGGFGAGGSPVNSLEIYSESAGTWSTLPVTLSSARARHTAVLLADGNVLFAGGVSDASSTVVLSSAEIWSPETGLVTAVATPMAVARHGVEGSLLPDRKVLIAGGTGTGGALSSTEIYNPATNGFAAGPGMSTARAGHSVTTLRDGRIFVAGGTGLSSVAVYDQLNGAWDNSLPAMSSDRAGHAGVMMGNGKVLVAGGTSGGSVASSAFTYDPALVTPVDAANGPMVSGRQGAETVILANGRVLFVGGLDSTGSALNSTEIFTLDGGTNFAPSAKIFTPLEGQSWALGATFNYRLIDAEGDAARVLFQFSYQKPDNSWTAWKSCTPGDGNDLDADNKGAWRDATPDNYVSDINHGLVNLATTTADNPLPINWIFPNSAGDHLFVWAAWLDVPVPAVNYPAVQVRAVPMGAARGTTETSFDFVIVRNTRVIPRFRDFTVGTPYYGTVRIDYALQDVDGADATWGEPARVVMEYGIDTNNDRQIAGSEVWRPCTGALGTEPIGTQNVSYPLACSKVFDPTVGNNGWHVFFWDSVRDIGAPAQFTTNNQVIMRLTAYDYPITDSAETQGLQAVMGTLQGFDLVLPPNGLYLLSWGTEGGQTYAGTSLGNVRLDERLTFNFNRAVSQASVDGIMGRTTLPVTVGGRVILGDYRADPLDLTKVYFYPQVVGRLSTGAPDYVAGGNPTVLTTNVAVRIQIPGYVPGTDPEAAQILKINGWATGAGAADIANLLAKDYNTGFTTSNSGTVTANYLARGAAGAPTATTVVPAGGTTGAALNQGFTVTLNKQVLGSSGNFAANMKFVVSLNGDDVADANDPVISGTWTIVNTSGPNATSVLTFTPLGTIGNYPTLAKILFSFAGLTAGDGTAALGVGGGTAATSFTTGGAGTVTSTTFIENFDVTTNMDPSTTALWNNASFLSRITGMRDGGSGIDGDPTSFANSSYSAPVRTFSTKAVYNFTSFSVPVGERWRFTGTASNVPVEVYCTGAMNIAGVIDLSGGDGPQTRFQCDSTTSVALHEIFGPTSGSVPATGGTGQIGGTGIAGGARGGNSVIMSYAPGYSVFPGIPYGGVQANSGGGGQSTYYYGGGGGGHAQAGKPGGYYTGGATIAGAAGTVFGNADFASNTGLLLNKATGGGGGGAGSSYPSYGSATNTNPSGTYYFVLSGGAGGAGGGGIRLACNTTFTLQGSGVIDVSGGSGGNGYYYSYNAGGGGGAGGGVWIQSGGKATLGGIIDISGGQGGDMIYTGSASYTCTNSDNRLSSVGGNGSAGRLQIECPNNVTMTTIPNFIAGAAYGTTTVTTNNGADGNLYGGTGALGAFPGSVSNAALNLDSSRDANGILNYDSLTIPAGVTIALTSGSNRQAKIRVRNNVSISGTLQVNGLPGNTTPNSTAYAQWTSILGPAGNNGGFAGGDSTRSNQGSWQNGFAGAGSGGGAGGTLSGIYSNTYYYMCAGAGGGSNLTNYVNRHINNGELPYYKPSAWTTSPGQSLAAKQGRGSGYIENFYKAMVNGGAAGTGGTNPETITMASTAGGSGGGGAPPSGLTTGSFYANGTGGAGGGFLAIEAGGTFTMAASGRIEAKGGNGGMGNGSYYGGGGGGGSGGTVLIRANTLAITAGATIDTEGGLQGLCFYAYQYGYYQNMYGGNGGRGGPGALRLQAVTNDPAAIYLNTAGFVGYSSTTGTLTRKTRVGGGDTALTNWQTAAGLGPDFHNVTTSMFANTPPGSPLPVGGYTITLEGLMNDPATGNRPLTYPTAGLSGSQIIASSLVGATPLTQGFVTPNAIDGFKHWRLRWTFSASNPAAEVYDTRVVVDTK